MYSKTKGGKDIPGQFYTPQVERYEGSDVLGMERTTARPMGYETGADPELCMPCKPWTEDCRQTMFHRAKVKGKKVATMTECE